MSRRWETPAGQLLVEVRANSTNWWGIAVPDLTEAYVYELRDKKTGRVVERYDRGHHGAGDDWIWFDRFLVVGSQLIRFACLISEGLSGDRHARAPTRHVVLSGLRPL